MMLRRKRRNPCPTYLVLRIAVRNMTGSADVVSLLNSYGQCVSNETLSRAVPSMAQRALDKDSMVPSQHQKQKPTTLAYDNININEETLTGEGTTHKVNGIIFQNVYVSVPAQPTASIPVPKRVRALKVPEKICLPHFILGKRPDLPTLKENTELPSEIYSKECLQPFALKEFCYLVVKVQNQRQHSDHTDSHIKPGWTECNKLMYPKE